MKWPRDCFWTPSSLRCFHLLLSVAVPLNERWRHPTSGERWAWFAGENEALGIFLQPGFSAHFPSSDFWSEIRGGLCDGDKSVGRWKKQWTGYVGGTRLLDDFATLFFPDAGEGRGVAVVNGAYGRPSKISAKLSCCAHWSTSQEDLTKNSWCFPSSIVG